MQDLSEKYQPILQNLIKQGVYEIRKIACLNLVKLMRINYFEKKRTEILKFFNEQLFKSKCYFFRMMYLEFVFWCSEFCSRNFMKLNLLPECFKLANDKVNFGNLGLCFFFFLVLSFFLQILYCYAIFLFF